VGAVKGDLPLELLVRGMSVPQNPEQRKDPNQKDAEEDEAPGDAGFGAEEARGVCGRRNVRGERGHAAQLYRG